MWNTSPWAMDVNAWVEHAHKLDVMEKSRRSSDDWTDHIRIIHIQYGSRDGTRARGLGVMTSPWHGEDRQFKSGRAHQYFVRSYPRVESSNMVKYVDTVSNRCTAQHSGFQIEYLGLITWIIGTHRVLNIFITMISLLVHNWINV